MNLDLAPVLAALPPVEGDGGTTLTNARRVLGGGFPRLHRWQRDGLTIAEAEDVAATLKRHPSELWTCWWEAVDAHLATLEVACACGCGTRFIPTRKGHKFASTRCRGRLHSREHARRRYAEDEAYRAQKRKAAASYYQECRRAVLARQRAWDLANKDRINARRRAQRKVA